MKNPQKVYILFGNNGEYACIKRGGLDCLDFAARLMRMCLFVRLYTGLDTSDDWCGSPVKRDQSL